MAQLSRAPFILLCIFLSWLFVLTAIFFVAAGSGSLLFMASLVPTLVFAVFSVLAAQSFSHVDPKGGTYFYASLISLLLVVLILVSPFLSFLSPVRTATTAMVTQISLLAIGKTPFEWAHPVKNAEEWIQKAWALPSGAKLNFNTFPQIPDWTRVCIFRGHSTDAQFKSVVKIDLPWQLSDKSKSTTHKDYAAIVFVDDSTKTISHVEDIQNTRIEFAVADSGVCFKPSQSVLNRSKEPVAPLGPVFSP